MLVPGSSVFLQYNCWVKALGSVSGHISGLAFLYACKQGHNVQPWVNILECAWVGHHMCCMCVCMHI